MIAARCARCLVECCGSRSWYWSICAFQKGSWVFDKLELFVQANDIADAISVGIGLQESKNGCVQLPMLPSPSLVALPCSLDRVMNRHFVGILWVVASLATGRYEGYPGRKMIQDIFLIGEVNIARQETRDATRGRNASAPLLTKQFRLVGLGFVVTESVIISPHS